MAETIEFGRAEVSPFIFGKKSVTTIRYLILVITKCFFTHTHIYKHTDTKTDHIILLSCMIGKYNVIG